MPITGPDTSGLNAVIRNEKRRAALESLESASFIDAHTVERLRSNMLADGITDRISAETLFSIERRGIATCAAWRDFFIEATVQYVVPRRADVASLGEQKAVWLLDQADRARTVAAFLILIAVLEEAAHVPRWFTQAVSRRAELGWPGLEVAVAA